VSKLYRVHHGAFGHVSVLELEGELVAHAHSSANISFWISGAPANLSINNRPVGHDGESAVLINSLVPHSLKVSDTGEPAHTLSFYLDAEWLAGVLPADLPRDFVQLDLAISPALRSELWMLADMLLDDGVDDIELDCALIGFLRRAVSACRAAPAETACRARKPSDFRLRKAVSLMRDNMARGLDMEAVARASGLSRPHFFSIFRDQLDLTPGIFWNSLRLEEAVHQMRDGSESLTTVASSLGFNAQGNFTRFFRQHTGVAPSAYRGALTKDQDTTTRRRSAR
jgi:AraC family transcriptional regulator